jgi:hypothetical protein
MSREADVPLHSTGRPSLAWMDLAISHMLLLGSAPAAAAAACWPGTHAGQLPAAPAPASAAAAAAGSTPAVAAELTAAVTGAGVQPRGTGKGGVRLMGRGPSVMPQRLRAAAAAAAAVSAAAERAAEMAAAAAAAAALVEALLEPTAASLLPALLLLLSHREPAASGERVWVCRCGSQARAAARLHACCCWPSHRLCWAC